MEGDGVFVIKIKTLKFYAHTFLSYNDKAGGKGSNIIGRCYLVSRTTFINRLPIFVTDIANHPKDDGISKANFLVLIGAECPPKLFFDFSSSL